MNGPRVKWHVATALCVVMLLGVAIGVPAASAGTPTFAALQGALYAAAPQSEAHFGSAVAVSGDTIVVGEPDRLTPIPGALGIRPGAAYVYVRSGSTWALQQELDPPALQDASGYGDSVAIDGNWLVVGAPGYTTSAGKTGAAFVYRRSGTTWSLNQVFEGTAVDGRYGAAVAMEMDTGTVAVGVPADGNGKVRVLRYSGIDWGGQATLTDPLGAPGDALGSSVALEGDTIAAGATGDDYGTVAPISNAGSVHRFTRSGGIWSHVQTVIPPDPTADGGFGGPLVLSAGRLLAGSWSKAVGGAAGAGCVYSYVDDGAIWHYERLFTAPTPTADDYYGSSIALDGRTALIGAFFADSYHGTAYFYTYAAGTWTMREKLEVTGWDPTVTQIGTSAALSGGTAVLGAQMANSPTVSLAGAAYAFSTRGAITGVARDAVTGLPIAGIEVSAYVGDQSGDPDLVALANTDAAGRYTFALDADNYAIGWMDGTQTYYPGFYNEAQLWPQATMVTVTTGLTTTVDLNVHPKPKAYLTKPVSATYVHHNYRFRAYGYLRPRHRSGSYPVKIQCYRYQRLATGGYGYVLRKTVSARAYDTWYRGKATRYSAYLSLPYVGRWRIRAYHPADAKYGPTYTGFRYITVR